MHKLKIESETRGKATLEKMNIVRSKEKYFFWIIGENYYLVIAIERHIGFEISEIF